jgi:hypothetical protein
MITGFKTFPTHHCITGSMRHIYAFHGHPISEEMLLGLGAGLGFIYWHMKGTLPIYGGRANMEKPGSKGFEKVVGERTGVVIESHPTSSTKKAAQALRESLSAGEPVMLYVDMGFLPYLGLPPGYHFGGHMIVAAGYDADQNVVTVADRDGEAHPVPFEKLVQARSSTFKPFPPGNAWYTCDFKAKRAPTPDEIRAAIGEVVEGMLNPPIANLGVAGIRTAAQRTLDWPGA